MIYYSFKTYHNRVWGDMSKSDFSEMTDDLPDAMSSVFLHPISGLDDSGSEIPPPDYNPEDVAFNREAVPPEYEEHTYCLLTLKEGQFQYAVDGSKYSHIAGEAFFDLNDYWRDLDTLWVGNIIIDSNSVSSIMILDEEDFNNAKEYGHMPT